MRGFLGVLFITIIFLPSLGLSHPGKTDRRGGHACRKDCSEWDLYVGEYHLHEDDYRPVKPGGTARPKIRPYPENNTITEVIPLESTPVPGNNLPDSSAGAEKTILPIPKPVAEKSAATAQIIPEPGIFFPDPLWLMLTVPGLMILLVALIARRKKTGG